jgi:hypothetical protein
MIADLADLWRKSDSIARFALLVAGTAVLVHLASLLGAGWSQLSALGAGLHLSVIFLIMSLVFRQLHDRLRGLWRAPLSRSHESLPRRLVWLCVCLGLYASLWFLGLFATYGVGGIQVRDGQHVWVRAGEIVRRFTPAQAQWVDAHALSVFSAAWLAAALPLSIAYQRRATRRALPTVDSTSAA